MGAAASRAEAAIDSQQTATLSKAASEAERHGDADNALRVRLVLADVLARSGALLEAETQLEMACELAARLGDHRLRAEAERMSGDIALHMVAYEGAVLHAALVRPRRVEDP